MADRTETEIERVRVLCADSRLNNTTWHTVSFGLLRRLLQTALERLNTPIPSAYACQRCGRRDGMDAVLTSDVWARIAGDAWNLLCLWCIDALAAEQGIAYEAKLFFTNHREPPSGSALCCDPVHEAYVGGDSRAGDRLAVLERIVKAARWFRALDGLGARVYLDAGAHCDAETFLTGSSGDGLGRRVTFGHMAELGDALAALDALDGVPNRCSTCRGTGRYEQWYPDGANLDFHRRLGECPVCRGTGGLR